MKPSLRHPIGERRGARRTRGGHRPTPAPELKAAAPKPDIAARQVREAGGPTDLACYACQCGYLFAAAVSTTVECPHCGTPQAW
jgi:hypothetical protein